MKPNDLSSTAVVDLTAIQTAIEELQPLFGGELALWRGHGDFVGNCSRMSFDRRLSLPEATTRCASYSISKPRRIPGIRGVQEMKIASIG